jgi:hypothetical protein
MDHT